LVPWLTQKLRFGLMLCRSILALIMSYAKDWFTGWDDFDHPDSDEV
jgi:hypothetical protein